MRQNSVALATSPVPAKLRVGVFADAQLQPRWVVEAFAKVAACEFAEVAVLGTLGGAPAAAPLLWRLYGNLDRRFFKLRQDPDELLELARYVPHQRKSAADPRALLAHDLDVAFALGAIDDTLLDGVARYGVWRFSANGLKEVAAGEPLTPSSLLVRLAPGAEPRIAYQSWSRTYALSVARNRAQLLAKTAEFPWRALREVSRYGHGWLGQRQALRFGPNGADAAAVLPALKSIGARILRRGVEKALAREQWMLAYRHGNGADAIPADLRGFTRIVPPADRSWADPFVLERGARHYVFFEELPFAAGKGHIAMTEIEPGKGWSPPVRVLERDYHLSYPFLLEHDGQLYMVPESARNGTVELYRCVEFPLRWKLEKVLLDGVRLVDATLHRGPDRWWMFANGAPGASRVFDDELYLYYADKLTGEWRPHPRNPVKSDARCARPAGRLYWRNGALYRPAQICAPAYGAGLSINRVVQLSPHAYAERQVQRILPSAGLLGLHTLNRAGDLTVVDALTRRSRFA